MKETNFKRSRRTRLNAIIFILCVLNLVLLIYFSYKANIAELLMENSVESKKYYYHLKLDTRNGPSEKVIAERISKELPYLPIKDLINKRYEQRNLNESCAWYPTMKDLRIRNDLWQEFFVANLTFYLFGAYLDNRASVVREKPVVRILSTMTGLLKDDKDYPKNIYCQFWYASQAEPIIMQATEILKLWYYEWGANKKDNFGHLIMCPLPEGHRTWIPSTVSVVSNPCYKATNLLNVVYKPLKYGQKKKGFAVCVKSMDFPYNDISHRIVEWLETVRALGTEKVLMYDLNLFHPNTSKVLEYYERTGLLELRKFSISLDFANELDIRHIQMRNGGWNYVQHEGITLNDCFYRNMYQYQYFATIDTDEVPMPLGNYSSWSELTHYADGIKDPNCQKFASFCFRCIYFPCYANSPVYKPDLPVFFYMLQHVHRVREHLDPESAIKCLHNSDYLIGTHNHFPMHVSNDTCKSYTFNISVAQLQHYREPWDEQTLKNPIKDTHLWRLAPEIIERSLKVFEDLNFLEKIFVDSP